MIPLVKLLAAMESPRAGGSFQRRVVGNNGSVEIQDFCFASGLASLHWKQKYRKHFGVEVIPTWVERIHPAVFNEVVRVTVQSNIPLPSERPA